MAGSGFPTPPLCNNSLRTREARYNNMRHVAGGIPLSRGLYNVQVDRAGFVYNVGSTDGIIGWPRENAHS